MHGLIVLGFNGAVVFHTSPLTRAVVDHIAEIVQSDLHMTVATQIFANVIPNKAGGGGSSFDESGNSSSAFSSTNTKFSTGGGGASSRGHQSIRFDPSATGNHHGPLGASAISRSQSNALYRASVAIDRSGVSNASFTTTATTHNAYSPSSTANDGSPSTTTTTTTTRGRGMSTFSPKEVESLAANSKKPRRFKFMARFDGGKDSNRGVAALSSNAAAPSTSSQAAASSYFISDAAFATSNCMARNCGGVCDGIIALSPSEHAWLRHHIALFVTIGEPRKEEADEDLIAADPEAVARVGVPNNANNSGSTLEIVGGGKQGSSGDPNASTTASSAMVFTRGVTVVPAQPSSQQSVLNASQGNALSVTKFVNPTTTAGGGIVLDPSVGSGELFVMLYWRKIGDRVFILVLHEEDSTALAKHILSAFVVLLAEAFKQYVPEGAEAPVGGSSGGSSHQGMMYQHASAQSGGPQGNASSDSASKALFNQMDRVMREDSALAQLPPLRAMLLRPDMVQRCVDIVAPQNIMAMVDLPMARVCLHRGMKAK